MNFNVCLIAISLCIAFDFDLVASASTATTPAKAKTTAKKRELYSCTNCIGKGSNCTGPKQAGCLYCMRIRCVVQGDPKDPLTLAALSVLAPGTKPANYIGKEVTIRKCISQFDLTTFDYQDTEGCGELDDFNCKGHGCLCKGDNCSEYASKNGSSVAPSSVSPSPSSRSQKISSTKLPSSTTKPPK